MTDAVEKVARLLDPQSWRVMDEGLASMLRKHRGQNIGYDPENFKHPQSIKRANEIIDTLKSLSWLSPDQLAARDAEVTRMALERAAAIAESYRQMRENLFQENGASLNASKADQADVIAKEILALSPPATGMKLVPEVPTEEMIKAGWIDKEDVNPEEIYRAMLAAVTVKP